MGIYYNQPPPFIGGSQPFGPSVHASAEIAIIPELVMTPDQLLALQLAIDLLLSLASPSVRGPLPNEGLRSQLRDARVAIS